MSRAPHVDLHAGVQPLLQKLLKIVDAGRPQRAWRACRRWPRFAALPVVGATAALEHFINCLFGLCLTKGEAHKLFQGPNRKAGLDRFTGESLLEDSIRRGEQRTGMPSAELAVADIPLDGWRQLK